MVYYCVKCGAPLGPGAISCSACGKPFAGAVPMDAEMPPAAGPAPALHAPGRRFARSATIVVTCLAAAAAIIGVCWGGSALWTYGPGGEIAFQQHNFAGNAAVERGDFADAINEYTQMVELRPQRVDGYLLRGISENKAGLFAKAIKDNTEALKYTNQATSRGDLYFNRALAWYGRRNLAKAIEDYTLAGQEYDRETDAQMLAYIPRRKSDVLRSRGNARSEAGQHVLAIADLTAVMGDSTPRPSDYGMRARSEAALGRDSAAQRDFSQSIKLDAGYLAGYDGLANLAAKKHDYRQAAEVFRRATQANPYNAPAWGNLGWFEYSAKNIPAAVDACRKSLSLDPNQAWVGYNLALCYTVSGDQVRATAAYDAAMANSNEAMRTAAINDIRDALRQNPKAAPLRMALAQLQKTPAGHAHGRPATVAVRAEIPPAAPVPAAFANLLAPDVSQNGYVVRPPAGYTLEQKRSAGLNGAGTTDSWKGRKRPDGTEPTLEVIVATDDGRMATETNSGRMVQDYLDGLKDNHSELTVSPITSCTISGRTFATAAWSGVGQRTGKRFKGEVYISVRSSEYIHIETHDAVAYSDTTLPLMRAAALTFRKL